MIWCYYALTFFMSLHFFGAVLVPFFTDWGGLTKFQMFILQSWFMIWIFLLEVPTGVIADKIGRKYSLALGAFAVTIGALIYGSIPKFEIFLLGEFLFAVAFALQSGADEAFLYDTLKEEGRENESAKVFGKAQSINLFGYLVAAPIGSLVAAKFGQNFPMLLTAVPFLIGSAIAWSMKEPVIHGAISESRRYVDIAKDGLRYFYHHRALRRIAADAIIVSIAAYYIIWFYQPLLQKLNMPIIYFGLFNVILIASQILISSNFSRLEKLFGSKKTYLSVSAFLTALPFILVAFFPNLLTILLLLIVAGGVGLTRLKLMTAYMNKLIPSAQRATVLSSINMTRRFSLAVINPIVGLTADSSLSLILLLVGMLPLAVFFFSPIEKGMLEE